MLADEFARRLRTLRIEGGYMTMRAFAEATGIKENSYARYERGGVKPSPANLEKICSVLKVTAAELHAKAQQRSGFSETQQAVASDPAAVRRVGRRRQAADVAHLGSYESIIWRLADVLARGTGAQSDHSQVRTAKLFRRLRPKPFDELAAILANSDRTGVWTKRLKKELDGVIDDLHAHFGAES